MSIDSCAAEADGSLLHLELLVMTGMWRRLRPPAIRTTGGHHGRLRVPSEIGKTKVVTRIDRVPGSWCIETEVSG